MQNLLLVAESSEADALLAADEPGETWNGFSFRGLDNIKLIGRRKGTMKSVHLEDPARRKKERLDRILEELLERARARRPHIVGELGPWELTIVGE
ncbi:MAG: hypothetical protein AB7K24_15385 [Gemmataceae bacterium]